MAISQIRPTVDILIPFHGQYEMVTRCVASIYACTPNQQYHIILIDDASPNPSFINTISQGKKTTGIRMDKQQGFGAALEAGFQVSKQSHLLIMHSDVFVENVNWLTNLQRALGSEKDNGVKLVSARTNNIGTAASYDPLILGQPEEGVFVVDSALPLFCAYCHRELFERIGGFLKAYPYAWYEDEELFWRMKYYGYKQAIAASSWVNHKDAGATIKYMWDRRPKIKQIMENNRALCLQDLKPYLPKKSRTPQA